MSRLKEFLTYKALSYKYNSEALTEAAINSVSTEDMHKVPLKNVCIKVTEQLADRIENTTAVMDVSKRKFIEQAIISALDEFDEIAKELNIYGDEP